MKHRILLIFSLVTLLVPLLTAFSPPSTSAISDKDNTSAEAAADRNAIENMCGKATPVASQHENCVANYVAAYLGDKPPSSSDALCVSFVDKSYTCGEVWSRAISDRREDYLDIPEGVCEAYIESVKGSKDAPSSLKNISANDKARAVRACNDGFKFGMREGSDCNSHRYSKDFELSACQAGANLADLHIFVPDEASGHAKGKALADIEVGESPITGSSDIDEIECSGAGIPGLDLAWIICPFVETMVDVTNRLDELINSLLSVGTPGNTSDPNEIFCNSNTDSDEVDSCQGYYKAWSSFRTIALGLMVIAGLVIIISEMLGFEILDAYTLRKVLPRLLIAAVGITLSWQLMQFLVEASNALGYGVRALIYAPFASGGDFDPAIQGGATFTAGLIGLGAAAFYGFLGLLSFGATALLAVFIAVIVLVLREMLIILAIILSPIFIIAYILPNTQGMYKLWWESFSKALLMFPFIAGFIAFGRVFAGLAGQSDTLLNQLLGFIGYFAPYFLLPLTFRFAGGALRTVGGFVNDRNRGAFDGLKRYRSNQGQKNLKAMQENRRFNPNSKYLGAVNRRMNTGLSSITDPVSAGKIYGGAALRKAGIQNSMGMGIINQIEQSKLQDSQKLAQKLNDLGFNDRALTHLMGMESHSASAIRAKAQELKGSTNNNDRIAGQLLEREASFLGQTLHNDPEMARADVGVAAGLAVTAQGFGSTKNIADLANSDRLKGTGLASSFVTMAQLNGQRAGRLDMKPGYGIQVDKNGKYIGTGFDPKEYKPGEMPSHDELSRMKMHQIKRLQTTGSQEFQSAKAGSVTAMAEGMKAMLSAPIDENGQHYYEYVNEEGQTERETFTTDEVKRVATMLGNAQSSYSGTSSSTADTINSIVASTNMSDSAKEAYDRARSGGMDPSIVGGGDKGGDKAGDKGGEGK